MRENVSGIVKSAVFELYSEIHKEVQKKSKKIQTERDLWWNLTNCILSSQVSYSTAVFFTNEIDNIGLLYLNNQSISDMEDSLMKILQGSIQFENKARRYRFPVMRAKQLAKARKMVNNEGGSLLRILKNIQNISDKRTWLVHNIPGIGPKQASMFLRNAGISYDLAVIDRHVMSYMHLLGISSSLSFSISSLSNYVKYEKLLREHAQDSGFRLGYMDWAIWIVMRVANNLRLEGIQI